MKNKKFNYPWRTNNTSTLLVDGDQYFPSMLESINNASHFIFIEIYLFESSNIANQFISAFIKARQRGVEIYLLLDDYGAGNLEENDKNKLHDAGCHICDFNPFRLIPFSHNLRRDHRKFLIIDNDHVYIGGAGITDDFSSTNNKHYWHETMLKIQGPVALDVLDAFSQTWQQQSNIPLPPLLEPRDNEKHHGHNKARVLIASGTERHEINRALVNHIRTSKERIWITSPYFVSNWKIRRALRDSARKGCDVRLVFPGKQSDHPWISHAIRRYYMRFLKAGIRIFEYQPRFTHSKVVMCDDWVTTGSSNFDRWNQYLNLDANIELVDKAICQQTTRYFKNDFKHSLEITLKAWMNRTTVQKMKEWISGILISWLGFISWKYRR